MRRFSAFAIVVVTFVAIGWIWVRLDMGLTTALGGEPKWSASTSAIVPDDFRSLWFPKSPQGITADTGAGTSTMINRAIYVTSTEMAKPSWQVAHADKFLDTPREEWTPCPPPEPLLSHLFSAHQTEWQSRGVTTRFTAQSENPRLWHLSYTREVGGVTTTCLYDVHEAKPGDWRVRPVEQQVETTTSKAAEQGLRVFWRSVDIAVRAALTLACLVVVGRTL